MLLFRALYDDFDLLLVYWNFLFIQKKKRGSQQVPRALCAHDIQDD